MSARCMDAVAWCEPESRRCPMDLRCALIVLVSAAACNAEVSKDDVDTVGETTQSVLSQSMRLDNDIWWAACKTSIDSIYGPGYQITVVFDKSRAAKVDISTGAPIPWT